MTAPGPAPGQLPAGYEFVRLLGEGGNGWVALARQVQLDRLVAVKTIHADLADEAAVARLQREGRAIASLRHPNVLIVYELAVSSTGIALVMEYVVGGDLRGALDANWLTGSHAVRVLGDTAAALEHAGIHGLVHRDVKPANVLIGSDGRAKLADFGLARLPRSSGTFRTIAGGAAGTPLYMAPEQIENPDLESPKIDAYAFAIMAYEVLVGARPFAARDIAALVYAHLYGEPISPWQFAPNLPVVVGEALLRGMAKNPADRPSPAQLMAQLTTVAPADWDAFFTTGRPAPTTADSGQGTVGLINAPVAFAGPGWQLPAAEPPIVLAPGRRYKGPRSRTRARLLGALIGIIVGVTIALVLLH